MDGPARPRQPIAHTRNEGGSYHDLAEHLEAVSTLAARFASKFGGAELGHWAGLWHDLGKFNPEFQQYLFDAEAGSRRRGPDHKAAGVVVAAQHAQCLAGPLQGHHGGMRDNTELRAWLRERHADTGTRVALDRAGAALGTLDPPGALGLPAAIETNYQAECFIRMLFSALVDADFLDTEAHFEAWRGASRTGYPEIATLWTELQESQEQLSGGASGPVAETRHQVYLDCLAAAEEESGIFRLTVPTGGGKTRSGLAFALRHATLHQLDRVIVAVPYLSITDQTAATYRDIFSNSRAVLEHHSAAEWRATPEDEGAPEETWQRLASENWDAPLIVTTMAQFFESLFARSTSRCRKLHNIARSVIILDEVQTLPETLLRPTLDILGELARTYGATVVLSTATQPALDHRDGFGGLEGVREIVQTPGAHFQRLQRVDYVWEAEPQSWPELATLMRTERQAMTIVNTRSDALALVEALAGDSPLHLSTLLCGQHRRDVLDEVKRRLEHDEPCLLVATQVVEAGVDIDFPVVFRALGPLDRIVQAAGRCNREGKLERGRVVIFRPAEGSAPPGAYKTGTDLTEMLLADGTADLHDPALYQRYFDMLFTRVNLDKKRIQEQRASYNFEEVARRYRYIDDDTLPVVVPYNAELPDGTELDDVLDGLRSKRGNPRDLWRKLQPFLLNVRRQTLRQLEREALVVPVTETLYEWTGDYDDVLGIGQRHRNPEALVA